MASLNLGTLKVSIEAEGTQDTKKDIESVGKTSEGLKKTFSALGKASAAAFGVVAAGVTAVGAALVAASESTVEYRENQNKLNTAFEQAGFSTEAASKAYEGFYGILGESDRSIEAVNHLAKMCTTEQELADWTTICAGVQATFGDSLPIEGLTEAANETAKTGTVTGALADALTWAGMSEDEFNAQLAACNSEQERSALITKTLTDVYGEAGKAFAEANAEIIRGRQIQEQYAQATAAIGTAVTPMINDFKALGAEGLTAVADGLNLILSGDVEGATQTMTEGISAMIEGAQAAITNIIELATPILQALVDAIAANIPTLVDAALNIVNSLIQFIIANLPLLVEAAIQIVVALAQGIAEMLPTLIPQIIQLVITIVETLIGNINLIIDAALQLVMGLADGILAALPILIDALPQLIKSLVDAILEALPKIIEAGVQILMALIDGIIEAIPELIGMVLEIILCIVEGILEALPQIIESGISILMSLIDGIIEAIPQLIAMLPEIIVTIVNTLLAHLPQIIQAAIQIIIALAKGLIQGIPQLVAKIPQIITSIVNGLKAGISKITEMGKNIVQGLWNGINGCVDWLKEKISGFCSSALNAIKDFFGIHSPSRLMKDEVGAMLVEGLAEGIEENDSAEKALEKMCKNLTDKAKDLLDNNDLEIDLLGDKYELWELQNDNATEEEKLTKQEEMLNDQLIHQANNVTTAQAAWEEMCKLTGENSEESKKLEQQLIQEMIAYEKLADSIDEVIAKRVQLNTATDEDEEARFGAYRDWYINHRDKITSFGYDDTEVERAARQATGYNGEKTIIQNFYTPTATPAEVRNATVKGVNEAEVALI